MVDGFTYHVSRGLYRRLAPEVRGGRSEPSAACRRRVLDACERTMLRIEREPHFARPDRYLFGEIRTYFPVSEQPWVRRLIEYHVEVARRFVAEFAEQEERSCQAFTRRGTPCQREPLPGSDFCPSHKHLETFGEREAELSSI